MTASGIRAGSDRRDTEKQISGGPALERERPQDRNGVRGRNGAVQRGSLGCRYLSGGIWNGSQILPTVWVHVSIMPDAPRLQPGPRPNATMPMGHGR